MKKLFPHGGKVIRKRVKEASERSEITREPSETTKEQVKVIPERSEMAKE